MATPELLEMEILSIDVSDGMESGDDRSYISYDVSILIPILNIHYIPKTFGTTINTGFYGKNGVLQKLNIPKSYVNIENDIFDLDYSKCEKSLCHISSLSLSPSSRCLKALLSDDYLDCSILIPPDDFKSCEWISSDTGTMVTAMSAQFFPFSNLLHKKEPLVIINSTQFITKGGNLVCGTHEYYLGQPNPDKGFSLIRAVSNENDFNLSLNEFQKLESYFHSYENFTINEISDIEMSVEDNSHNDQMQSIFILSVAVFVLVSTFLCIPLMIKKCYQQKFAQLKALFNQ